MNVINHIRIKKETVGTIRKLEAVERVDMKPDGSIVVHLRPEFTEGKEQAVKNEYLVQWSNGKWQRFGTEAFQRLFFAPNDTARQWRNNF